ncbi:MAG: hypothetical protein H6R14_1420 [Proteobacteria bacterium]|nr:hypothetical protein [Pseudomonadota bacterium]
MRATLLFLHLAGVIVWVGGMFFAHFCLRPVAAEQLPLPQRLPLLAGVLGRFFKVVAVAIALILLSGIARLLNVGFAAAPLSWHLMLSSGLVMTAIFAIISLRDYPRLRAGVAAQDWPAAGAAMNAIRQRVAINLALGVATVAIACFGLGF